MRWFIMCCHVVVINWIVACLMMKIGGRAFVCWYGRKLSEVEIHIETLLHTKGSRLSLHTIDCRILLCCRMKIMRWRAALEWNIIVTWHLLTHRLSRLPDLDPCHNLFNLPRTPTYANQTTNIIQDIDPLSVRNPSCICNILMNDPHW